MKQACQKGEEEKAIKKHVFLVFNLSMSVQDEDIRKNAGDSSIISAHQKEKKTQTVKFIKHKLLFTLVLSG